MHLLFYRLVPLGENSQTLRVLVAQKRRRADRTRRGESVAYHHRLRTQELPRRREHQAIHDRSHRPVQVEFRRLEESPGSGGARGSWQTAKK